jgi:hypothetical protein
MPFFLTDKCSIQKFNGQSEIRWNLFFEPGFANILDQDPKSEWIGGYVSLPLQPEPVRTPRHLIRVRGFNGAKIIPVYYNTNSMGLVLYRD